LKTSQYLTELREKLSSLRCFCTTLYTNRDWQASSILRHADFHTTSRNLPFATEFAACRGKRRIARFFLHLYL